MIESIGAGGAKPFDMSGAAESMEGEMEDGSRRVARTVTPNKCLTKLDWSLCIYV